MNAVLITVVVVAALYFGREVLVPIALAGLMSFVLAPPVRLLQGLRVPRTLAVLAVVLIAFAAVFGLAALMVSQVNQLASDLPSYQTTLRDKIQNLRGASGSTTTLERASEVLQDLGKELDKPTVSPPRAPIAGEGPASNRPIPVEVRQPDPGALQTLVALITPLIHPLTTTGIVLVFVIFILIQRQDLRNRLVRLAGARDLQRTTAALDDAGQRLSRLFLAQVALNAAFGLVVGTGLWFIGVPSAPLWGMLAMILRFVPYIGAIISAIFPLILAAAVGPGWTMVLSTAALFLILEPIAGQVIEPLLFGHTTGLSPVAVIASATFWTWLWGPIGLILATPLTICLVVLGRHVDGLKFFDVMLGDQPALTAPQLVYQRMLARDPIEAAEQAQLFLKDKPLLAYYEEVLLEGLKLAQADAERGLLDEERLQYIRDAAAEIIDDLSSYEDEPLGQTEPDSEDTTETPLAQIHKVEVSLTERSKDLPAPRQTASRVLCIPGLNVLDEAVALILAQLTEKREIPTRVEKVDALSMSRIFSLDIKDVNVVCVCYVETPTAAQVHYAIRRLRRKAPQAIIVLSLLGHGVEPTSLVPQQASSPFDFCERSLRETVERISLLAHTSGPAGSSQPSLVGPFQPVVGGGAA